MCLDHHPGFDSGGTLWFQNLTEYPHGVLRLIFPFVIAGLHITNVQLSFEKSTLQNVPGPLGSLAKGSLVYWLTNSTLTLIQGSCLRNPTVLKYFGLSKVNTPVEAPTAKTNSCSGVTDIVIYNDQERSTHPKLITSRAGQLLDQNFIQRPLALEKDPEFVRAMLIMGQTLLQNKQLVEAAECLETAISKLLDAGYPIEVEDIDLLILSSQWAGIANVQQGKMEHGLVHLERIAQLKEPNDSKSKSHYYDGLLVSVTAYSLK